MKIELEPHDIRAIADRVVQELRPLLDEIREAVNRKAPAEPRPQVASVPRAERDVVNRAELERLTGLSATTLWRMETAGRFPARVQLSHKRVGWRRSEVAAWLAEREAA